MQHGKWLSAVDICAELEGPPIYRSACAAEPMHSPRSPPSTPMTQDGGDLREQLRRRLSQAMRGP